MRLEPMTVMLVACAAGVALEILDAIRGVTSRLDDRQKRLRQLPNTGIAFMVLCLGLWF